jgi:hypothetical protein
MPPDGFLDGPFEQAIRLAVAVVVQRGTGRTGLTSPWDG